MRVLLSSMAAAIALSLVAAVVLRIVQEPVHETFASSSARVSTPGTNLVGERWTGNPHPDAPSAALTEAPRDDQH